MKLPFSSLVYKPSVALYNLVQLSSKSFLFLALISNFSLVFKEYTHLFTNGLVYIYNILNNIEYVKSQLQVDLYKFHYFQILSEKYYRYDLRSVIILFFLTGVFSYEYFKRSTLHDTVNEGSSVTFVTEGFQSKRYDLFRRYGGEDVSELFNKEEFLKGLIKRLHEEPDSVGSIREDFMKVVRELTPVEIAQVEQKLVEEGMPAESIQLMCNIHLDVFREALDEDDITVEPWHPLHILIEEHRDILNQSKKLRDLAGRIGRKGDIEKDSKELSSLLEYLDIVELYFSKEENVLFPYLERHGLVQPPAIMWKEHDDVRELRKALKNDYASNEGGFKRLSELAVAISEIFSNHIYKEHKILFPSSLKLLSQEEWEEIRTQFDEIGYFAFEPMPFSSSACASEIEPSEDVVNLGSGFLKLEQLKLLMNSLPFDITFVDENDVVRYFSEGKERAFVRTRAIIGRKVQNCHPQKSAHIVERILSDFKGAKRDVAEFWLSLGPKMVHIRYFALRDEEGKYAGTLEVTQEISKIRALDGEKRIYDPLD